MAKRGKKKKIDMVKYGRFIVIGVFVLFVLIFIYNRGVYFLKHSDLFRIKEVVKEPALQFVQSRHLKRLIDKNIFTVDLKSVRQHLKSRYPQIDQLKISRKFPNRIYISARKRDPFAVVKLENNNVVIDEHGVVIYVTALSRLKLPGIHGVMPTSTISVGKSLRNRAMNVAIDIIKRVQKSEYLASDKIESVDVSNLSKIDFRLSSGLKVIVDQYYLEQKIEKLGILLSEGNLNRQEISYVDLRFREPVSGKNNY